MWSELLLTLHYIVAALFVLRVLLRPQLQPSVRLAWILVIESLPWVGMLSYVLFGEIRLRRADIERARDVRQHLIQSCSPSAMVVQQVPEHVAAAAASAEAVGGLPMIAGNDIELLAEGDEAIDDMVAAIDAATDHVHMLFYIWLPDVSGRKVADAAIRATGRGVAVRVIVDAFGSRGFVRSDCWSRMMAAGVDCVRAFPMDNPFFGMIFRRMDVRNHRKVVVIDNQTGFTGSRNCADMAFAAKPRFGPWVDVWFRVQGPVLRQMQLVFLADWMAYRHEDLGPIVRDVPAALAPNEIAQVIATGPDRLEGSLSDTVATLIHSARDRIVITTPYYVPDAPLDAAIRATALRGVKVTLILPQRNDSMLVQASSEGFYRDLLKAGISIHLFQPGLLHSKIITVDDHVSLIGSANLDRRSFELNYESNMLVVDGMLTDALNARQDSYIARSRPLPLSEVQDWSRLRRVRNNLLALAAPLL